MTYPILKGGTGTPIVFGPMILSSDHVTATGDLHTTVAVTISKNGGAFGAPSGAISWLGAGWYAIAGNATDSNTAGPIAVSASVATNDPFDQMVAFVVDPAVALFGANAVNIGGTAQTGRDIGASVLVGDKTGFELSAAASAALTEGYPTKGGTGTLPQLLYALLQHLEEASISGTTKTVKKRDQATTAETLTLNDASAPTSITRAT